jgi:hypothetical protein
MGEIRLNHVVIVVSKVLAARIDARYPSVVAAPR